MVRPLAAAGVILIAAACSCSPPRRPPPEPAAPQEVLPNPAIGPFDAPGVTTYDLVLPPEKWAELVGAPHAGHWYRCTLKWRGETVTDVGIRASGQTSRVPGNAKPSLRVSFKKYQKDRRFHGLSGFKLDALHADPSMLRERLAYSLYRDAGLPVPREVHARVRINDELKGLYAVEERIGTKFLKKHFGTPIRQLYYWTGQADDLDWLGSNPALYVPDLLKHRDRTQLMNGKDIADLIDTIANKDYSEAARAFDMEVFFRQLAVEVLTGETDGFIGVSTRQETKHIWSSNFFLYRDPRSGKFRIIVWDRDQSFWRPIGMSLTTGFSEHMFTRRLVLDREESLRRFRGILRELLAGPLAPDRVVSRLDSIYREIRAAAFEDTAKAAGSNEAFTTHVHDLRTYIRSYSAAMASQLARARD